MPELPEVETVARGLHKQLVGDVIERVEVLRKESVGYPTVAKFQKLLPGHKILSASRRGKYVVVKLSGGAHLVIHLRMSGRLIVRSDRGDRTVTGGKVSQSAAKTDGKVGSISGKVGTITATKSTAKSRAKVALIEAEEDDETSTEDDGKAPKFLRITMKLKSGRYLDFEDMRVFGRQWFVGAGEKVETVVSGIASLGVEPFEELTRDYLSEAFRNKKQPIKSALLDQRIIAGIGNIYADESLFLSRIHPQVPAGNVKGNQLDVLIEKVKLVLNNAIELGGSTLRDYTDSSGVNGNYQHGAWVYGRTGKECRVCKEPIARLKLAGRSSHFCPLCQPLRKTGKQRTKMT